MDKCVRACITTVTFFKNSLGRRCTIIRQPYFHPSHGKLLFYEEVGYSCSTLNIIYRLNYCDRSNAMIFSPPLPKGGNPPLVERRHIERRTFSAGALEGVAPLQRPLPKMCPPWAEISNNT